LLTALWKLGGIRCIPGIYYLIQWYCHSLLTLIPTNNCSEACDYNDTDINPETLTLTIFAPSYDCCNVNKVQLDIITQVHVYMCNHALFSVETHILDITIVCVSLQHTRTMINELFGNRDARSAYGIIIFKILSERNT
jgi:hypothetical protein